MIPDIVITGAGVISAIGVGKAETLDALCASRSGVGSLKYLHSALTGLPVGEVKLSNEQMRQMLSVSGPASRTSLMGIISLREALEQAGIPAEDFCKIPLISGTTVGGMDLTEKSFPEYSPLHDCGASTDSAADYFGGFKWATTLSTACSSAANAVIFGANLIRSGAEQIVIAGGSESLSDFHYNGFNSLMILDGKPCRPFDATRSGLNLGEGAAFLVLETAESAVRRGVKPVARLGGYGNACDAFHQTASSENGEGAFLAMEKAIKTAGLEPGQIDYVNAHGTGTVNNDASESAALRRVFGDRMPAVSSTKPFTGHTTSASGSIEAVFCLLALEHGFIPPQLNWTEADPACIAPSAGGRKELNHILCNAFGFGGNDSSLLFSKWQ